MDNMTQSNSADFTNLQEISSQTAPRRLKDFAKENRLWEAQSEGRKVLLLLDKKKEKIASTAAVMKPDADLMTLYAADDRLVTETSKIESYFSHDEQINSDESPEQFAANYQTRIKLNGMKQGIQIDDPKLTDNANRFLMDKICLTLKLKEAEAYKQKLLECLSETNVNSETMKQYLTSHDIITVKKLQNNGNEEISGVAKIGTQMSKER